jgi:hypothetical protein
MQASANDTLTKQLIELSGKFDKLAGKYEEKKEPFKEAEKKEDLQLSWANMQASANDTLTKQLVELSAKFDKIAGKYEEKKKAKAIKQKKKKSKPKKKEEYSDDEPPYPPPKATAPKQIPVQRQAPPQQTQKPAPQRLPMGVYRRAGPLSISQF